MTPAIHKKLTTTSDPAVAWRDLPDGSRPVFLAGSWIYPRPRFDSVPPPNEKIIIMSWPVEYALEDGKMKVTRKQFLIETPPDCNREWFVGTVLFNLGYDYCGWIYAI
jgi:hypothetical protein